MRKEVLTSRGLKIAYRRCGDAGAPAVLLLMGLGMPMDAWPPALISGLLAEGFQVVAPDNRDSGESSRISSWCVSRRELVLSILKFLAGRRVTGEYALEDMALDAERLLDGLAIRRAHVVGFSLGGMIAQVFACQCPNRAATLVSISSAVGNPKTGLGRIGAVLSILRGGSGNAAAAQADMLRLLTALAGDKYPPDPKDAAEFFERAGEVRFEQEAAARQILAMLASGNRARQVKEIRAPALVIHGKADPLLPAAAGLETASLIPNSKIKLIEGLGHSLPPVLMPQYAAWIAAHCRAHPA